MSLEKLCPKIQCEICGNKDKEILERHHIVERTELESNNHPYNLAVLCPNCHSLNHTGKIKIIGVFPGTKPPTGRILIYIKDGVCNLPGGEDLEPYYIPTHKSMKIHKGKK